MKTIIKQCSVLVFLICFSFLTKSAAADTGYEKKKTISRSFSLNAARSFGINNQFGNIVIRPSSGNEIKVDIEITAEAADESYAQELIDRVSITETGAPDIFFRTEIKKQFTSGTKKANQKFNIQYTVLLPGTLPLTLKNQFGNIDMGDYSGVTKIHQKFGNLSSGNLSKMDNITVEFGKIKTGDLSGNGSDIVVKYSNGTIGELNGSINTNIEFSNIGSLTLGNNATNIYIKNDYSNTEIKVPSNFAASFNIAAHFGKFINKTDLKFSGDEDEGRFNDEYTGTSGNGSNKVTIKTNFGNIKLVRM